MQDQEQIIEHLENGIRKLDRLSNILFYITTIDERRSTLEDTLALIEKQLLALDDPIVCSMHEKILKKRNVFLHRYEQILQTDFNAFLNRLAELWFQSAVEANEADIALRQSLGLDAARGIWGGKGWHPPASFIPSAGPI